MKKRILSVLLIAVMLTCLVPLNAFAEEEAAVVSHGIRFPSNNGNATLNLTHEEVFEKFAFGDIVTVMLGDLSVDMPIVDNYACVDIGAPALYMYRKGEKREVRLVVNMQAFAYVYAVAYQPDAANDPLNWVYNDGFSEDMDVAITMKEQAGYLADYQIRSMTYTFAREDFPQLTDEEFANFRMVEAGDIAPGVLYRSATAIQPERGRSVFADEACREAGVTVFINLVNSEETEQQEAGFAESYYSGQKRICLGMTMDVMLEDNRQKLAQGLRFMAENPGVYDVFCQEGKDRTGFFLVLLEALMGADSEEILQDYMTSYYNYYGITPEDAGYAVVENGVFLRQQSDAIGATVRDADFSQQVEAYILGLGLTQAEISQLKANLSGGETVQPEPETTEAAPQKEEETIAPALAEPPAQEPTQTAPAKAPASGTGITVICIAAVLLLAGLAAVIWKKKK